MKRFVFLIMLLGCMSTTAAALDWWEDEEVEQDPQVSLEVKAWINRLRGNIAWGRSDNPGSDISFRDDLNLGSSSFAPYIGLNVGLSENWSFRFHFWRAFHEERHDFPRDIDFAGTTFAQGTDTMSEFSLSTYSALAGYRFIDGPQIDVTGMFGVALFRTRMEMFTEPDNPVTRDSLIPAPQLGIGVDVELLKNLVLRGHVTGMYSTLDKFDGCQTDLEASFVWTVADGLELIAGYKAFRANVDFNKRNRTDSADFTAEGPFVGLGFRF